MGKISRVIRSKEEAKASYNIMSKWYDLLVGHSENKFRESGLAKLYVQEMERCSRLDLEQALYY